jgi:hypothetical protein
MNAGTRRSSGFTHRVSNQVRNAPLVEPEEVAELLKVGRLDDPRWQLRILHEAAHVELNYTPVGQALGITELSLDSLFYEQAASLVVDPTLLAARQMLDLVYDMLDPWCEAVALSTEWDLDSTAEHWTHPHGWMVELEGHEGYDDRLWRARLSPLGIARKGNTLVSSCYRQGHLLGHLLSRAAAGYSGLRADEIVGAIVRCVFCNFDLADAILDLVGLGGSPASGGGDFLKAVRVFGDAIDVLVAELTDGPSQQCLIRLSSSTDAFLARTQPTIMSFLHPISPPQSVPNDSGFLRRVGRDIAHGCWSQRGFVRLGYASVDLTTRNGQIMCSIEGQDVFALPISLRFTGPDRGVIEFGICAECGASQRCVRVSSEENGLLFASDDDPHLAGTFSHQQLGDLVERAQKAADLLTRMEEGDPGKSELEEVGSEVAAWAVKDVIIRLTGFTLDLPGLSETGVAEAIDNDITTLQTLALLSNEFTACRTDSGRTVVEESMPRRVTENRLDLDRRLASATGMPLDVKSRGGCMQMW